MTEQRHGSRLQPRLFPTLKAMIGASAGQIGDLNKRHAGVQTTSVSSVV